MHPERRRRTDALARLADEGAWEAVYRRLVLWEFPGEARMGWQLAFLRPFAVPRMAETLVEAGHLVHDPTKRAYDTGLIIYEIVHGGLDSPRARQMVALMNRAHHGHSIAGEDMTYVLCAFMVAPIRYIERAGWRPLTTTERESSARFYARMGELMNIDTIPGSYEEAAEFFDGYEAAMIRPSQAGRLLGVKLVEVLRTRLPRALRPAAAPLFTVLLGDLSVTEALGLPQPSTVLTVAVRAALGARRRVVGSRPPRTRPIFTPGMPAGSRYPSGYDLSDLGPPAAPAGRSS